MYGQLIELSDWLSDSGVKAVAMESTGVYWKPVYNLLEGEFELIVANARHIKNVPGRKTDVRDAQWIAELLRHGLLEPSFIPDRPARELRELTRYRRRMVQQRVQVANRMHKTLEGGNVKLASVASDILGVSGRDMLRTMIDGETDPKKLANMARGLLRKKLPQLQWALEGTMGTHQRFMLESQLRMLETLESEIARLDEEVRSRLIPLEDAIDRIDDIPGIGRRNAEDIMAEIGADMSRFPSAAHLASWAKLSPGNYQSAGRRRSGHTGHGNTWLKSALTEAAQSAARTKDTYLSAQYRRIATRRGSKRAATAVAHTIIKVIYHMLRDGTAYHDLGGNYFDQRNRNNAIHRYVRGIERLAYQVTLEVA